MTCIVDAGSGNLRSLANALREVGIAAEVCPHPPAKRPEVLLLPGVGAFGHAAERLCETGWDETLKRFVGEGSRLVGICLGMQLLLDWSEESPGARGLGLIRGSVRRLGTGRAKVPHIAWARLRFEGEPESPLPWAYFVHSFAAEPEDPTTVEAWATHGGREFPAAIRTGGVVGVQFHPEKSQVLGLAYLAALLGGRS